eukprot:gene22455-4640_t
MAEAGADDPAPVVLPLPRGTVNATLVCPWQRGEAAVGLRCVCVVTELRVLFVPALCIPAADPSPALPVWQKGGDLSALVGGLFGRAGAAFAGVCAVDFLDIANIHNVRGAFADMRAAAADGPADGTPLSRPYSALTARPYCYPALWVWGALLVVLLRGARAVAASVVRGGCVVVHCSDGWDRTPQLCSLACAVADPWHRTVAGLAGAVARDWAAFGHHPPAPA